VVRFFFFFFFFFVLCLFGGGFWWVYCVGVVFGVVFFFVLPAVGFLCGSWGSICGVFRPFPVLALATSPFW